MTKVKFRKGWRMSRARKVKRKKGWRMNCDVGEATEGFENELWCR